MRHITRKLGVISIALSTVMLAATAANAVTRSQNLAPPESQASAINPILSVEAASLTQETYTVAASAKRVPSSGQSRFMSAEARKAFSPVAKDMEGWMPSLYRGIWWDQKWRDLRVCIMKRESNFRYRAANKTSSARGAYQFLDNNWRDGLVWMFIDESKQTGDGLISEAKKLRKVPIHKWSRYWQDRAFYTALRNGKGIHHWKHQIPGTGCF